MQRLARENWIATVFAVVTVGMLVSHDLEIGSTFHASFDAALFLLLYLGMLRRTRRLLELETSSTRDEALAELRTTIRVVLPIAGFIPALTLVQRLVFGR